MQEVIEVEDGIFYFPSSENPISAEVCVIKGNKKLWIYDAGCTSASMEFLQNLEGRKNFVISHFHPDHMGNIIKGISFENLFIGKNTFRYCHKGSVVSEPLEFDDGVKIKIVPLPNSHAKGSLLMQVNKKYTLVGDALYAQIKLNRQIYNQQLLKQEIELLRSIETEFFLVSHAPRFIQKKERVISRLEFIYSMRKSGSTEIDISEKF